MRCASKHSSSFFTRTNGTACVTGVIFEGASAVVGDNHCKVARKETPVVTTQAAKRMVLLCVWLSIAALDSNDESVKVIS